MNKETTKKSLSFEKENSEIIAKAVERVVNEYKETLELLAEEDGNDKESS
ncbi:MAG: hypothetical protein G01um101477_489 [Candidatus Doudnabacteria bacterium Gr01-1014_77]|uniref:Uncharacterized protein n=1 Tax=Candidatus Doudnabacteria bacterium Gr01-1014_77 TaxID=2017133 RepID=A0A554JAQ2_9BACT|nr:MAG: hypothetical protein G01um101477_489 [Candidatus Doudnabacteria bacterium Gr01-1014_77]